MNKNKNIDNIEIPSINCEDEDAPFIDTTKNILKSENTDIIKTVDDREIELKVNNQKHIHKKEDNLTKWGTWIVCGILASCFFMSMLASFFNLSNELMRDFYTIATTALTLILGYLFSSKKHNE